MLTSEGIHRGTPRDPVAKAMAQASCVTGLTLGALERPLTTASVRVMLSSSMGMRFPKLAMSRRACR